MHKLICVEGLDGCGKSSLVAALAKHFEGKTFCFPMRSNVTGRLVDKWLKGEVGLTMERGLPVTDPALTAQASALALQCVMTCNRLEALSNLNELRKESVVFCDRYWQSGYAYGVADGLSAPLMRAFHATLPKADLTLLLDAPSEVGIGRQESRGKREFYESKGVEYFAKVRENYLAAARGDSTVRIIAAARPFEEVYTDARHIVMELLLPGF